MLRPSYVLGLLLLAGCTFATRPLPRPPEGFEVLEIRADLPLEYANGKLWVFLAGTRLLGNQERVRDGAVLFCGDLQAGAEEGFTCLARDGDAFRARAQYLMDGPLLRPPPGVVVESRL